MLTKNEQIGFRLPAGMKKELQEVAKREGRTLSQICEMFITGGLEAYSKEGAKYFQRLLSRPTKEHSG
jgi:predicted DNA-binding protein